MENPLTRLDLYKEYLVKNPPKIKTTYDLELEKIELFEKLAKTLFPKNNK